LRKLILTGTLAALTSVLLVVPASGWFDSHFTVLAKQTSGKGVGHTKFGFRERLVNPVNRDDKVGRDWGECRLRPKSHKVRCRVLAHLNGDIGGFGNLRIAGNLGNGDHRVSVVGGTHDFNGVAGKVIVHSPNSRTTKLRFALVR
jgi:hypothetical protein